jgi:hypothetical protein
VAQDNEHNPSLEEHPAGKVNDPYSRRKFLRAAVVGTAGVAGAAGVAGVILSRSKSPGLFTVGTALSGISIHDSNCSACATTTSYGAFTPPIIINGMGNANPGDFFIWFTAPGLPAGTYDLTFTPDPNFSTNGTNWAYLDVYNGTGSTGRATACPNTGSFTPSNEVNKGCVDGAGCVFPYTVPSGQTQDLQFHAHMKFTGAYPGAGVTETFTFQFSLNAVGNTYNPVCSGTVTFTGKGKK